MLCAQLVGDSTVLKEKVAHCHLKRLEVLSDNTVLPFLNGVKDNVSITYIHVASESITTCLRVTILYYTMACMYVIVTTELLGRNVFNNCLLCETREGEYNKHIMPYRSFCSNYSIARIVAPKKRDQI